MRLASLVLISHNSAAYLEACLGSISGTDCKLVLVDNGSSDGTVACARKFGQIQVISLQVNLGYAKAVNSGCRAAEGEIVVISNVDVSYDSGSIQRMLAYMQSHPRVGVLGPQLYYPEGSWQRSCGYVPGIWSALVDLSAVRQLWHWLCRRAWPLAIDRWPRRVGYVDGAVMMVRRAAFAAVGGFDENLKFYGEDSDFCERVRAAGWDVVFYPKARVMHVQGGSSGRMDRLPEDFYRLLVQGKIYVAAKRHSAAQVRLYRRLEALQAKKMKALYSLIAAVLPSKREFAQARVIHFDTLYRFWSEQNTVEQASIPVA